MVSLPLAPQTRQQLLAAGFTTLADLEHVSPENLAAGEWDRGALGLRQLCGWWSGSRTVHVKLRVGQKGTRRRLDPICSKPRQTARS